MQKVFSHSTFAGVVAGCLVLALSVRAQEVSVAGDAGAVALLKEAQVAAAKITDADGAASAYWSIGALLTEAKQDEAAVAVLAIGREKAFAVRDRMRRWELVEIIAHEEAKAGANVDLDGYLAKAENDAQQSAVISSVAAGHFERGEKETSRKLFDRAWKHAEKISGPYKEVFFLSLADDAARAGDHETAKQFYGRFRDYLQMLGGQAEFLGMRKLGEAQLEAKLRDDALRTFQSAAAIALEGNAPEDAGEVAGLMAAAGFTQEADIVIGKFMALLEKSEPAAERSQLAALLADTLNREGVFPGKVLELLKKVSADDRIYLLPEAAMNLASSGEKVAAAGLLPQVHEPEDQVSVMCAISDAWWKAKDADKAKDWATRALTTAKTIKEEDVQRESLLEVAEQLVSVGLSAEAKKTWQGVADTGEEFRRAIAEREFFQWVEDHDWKKAEAALKAMADSPDISVLQSGLAAELAKEGQIEAALKTVERLPPSLSARLEIIRLAYEKQGSSLSRDALAAVLAKQTDPEIIVSLIIGHVGGFRRLPATE
ncbi:MAG: hypothetical protein KDN22_26940 [Verrucomicrobiae bacterium]|nr:hypothetical protein [Verrucomicrobiae bacterium]